MAAVSQTDNGESISKAALEEASEKQGGAGMGVPERVDTIWS